MSESVSPTPAFMASVLSTLNGQQATVPEAQRGLAPELKDLTARLAADPALENDPRFGVEVAWLVQDWQRFSGTGQAPALPPVLLAGLRVMAQDLPGMQNADLKTLLAQTGAITDRNLVRDFRQQALRVAAMPPAEQIAVGAAKAVAVLEYRLSQAVAPAQPPAQAAQAVDPAPVSPAHPTTEAGATAARPTRQAERVTPAADASAKPSPEAAPAASIADPSTSITPAQESAATDQSMRAEDKERADAAENVVPAGSVGSLAPNRPAAQAWTPPQLAPAVEPEGADKGAARDGRTPPTNVFTPPPAQTSPGAQAIADVVAGGVNAALAPVTGVVQGIGRGISSHIANARTQSDRRAIDGRVDELRATNRKVDAHLDTVREQGRPFFASFDKAVEQAGGNAQQVITDMAPGRPHEALHQELRDTLAKTPAFSDAWNQLKSSTSELGRQSEYLRVEADRRAMSKDPTVVESEQDAAKTGWKLTNLPGIEGGKNFVQEASKFVEMLVERMRDFLARVFGRGEERNQSPSPGR